MLICGANDQVPEPPLNRPDRSGLKVPALAVRLMLGKNAARAAPMLALAASRLRSAWRMSGRRCNRSDGNPAGTSLSRSEEHTSELQSLMRISYAVFCLKTQIK